MNRDPDFELSADMRLLELQRSALGLTPPNRTQWETRYAVEGTGEPSPTPLTPARSAVLAVEAVATPASGVIPGAVVTVSLSIANEGAVPASGIVASVPLPGGASYRAGSFVFNGRTAPDEIAERFFGAGVALGDIGPGERASYVWKIGVRLGAKPLVIAPHVHAAETAVIGARPLSITRKDHLSTGFVQELTKADAALFDPKPLIPVDIPADELPIYELDDEEQLVHEAAEAALRDAAAQPVEEPPVLAAVIESIEPPRESPTVPVREGIVRYTRFERTTLVFFERTFLGSKPPTILQHCIFASALACATDDDGNDDAGLKRHLEAQSQVLHRIVLHEKLGKKEPIAEYAGELLANFDALAPAPIEEVAASNSDALLLVTEFSAPTLVVIKKIAEERERWDFVKARQLTLALQAQRANLDDAGKAAAIENALQHYAQTSMTTLQKLFVRIRIDRTTGLLSAGEPSLDASARRLLAALSAAITR